MMRPRQIATATLGGVVAAAIGISGLTVTPAHAARVNQTLEVTSETITIQGAGFGHGSGMSQYGARGAARQGLTWRQILAFYYPGTTLDRASGDLRVWISADTDGVTEVLAEPGLRLLVGGKQTDLARPEARRWRLVKAGSGNDLQYFDGAWRRVGSAGANPAFSAADGMLDLVLPSGSVKRYRGDLRQATPQSDPDLRKTINLVTLDEYVKGVVAAEMPSSWEAEAVRSQSVAARTYAAYERAAAGIRSYDICDTTRCQVYGGVSAESAASNAAVDATSQTIVWHEGAPAFTQFSSSNGGWSARYTYRDFPYLRGQRDPYEASSGNPLQRWSVEVSASRLEALSGVGDLRAIRVTDREGMGRWGGRVYSLTLVGSSGSRTYSGGSFASALGLRSSYFTFAGMTSPRPSPAPTPTPTPSPTPTPTPTPNPDQSASPRRTPAEQAIIARWRKLGGADSTLGRQSGRRVVDLARGKGLRFEHGWIIYSAAYGAWPVSGALLRKYQTLGATSSVLGVPRGPVRNRQGVTRLAFENGVMYQRSGHGIEVLHGAIADRYLRAGEGRSVVGWPVTSIYGTSFGERAEFEHGRIALNRSTGKTYLKRS